MRTAGVQRAPILSVTELALSVVESFSPATRVRRSGRRTSFRAGAVAAAAADSAACPGCEARRARDAKASERSRRRDIAIVSGRGADDRS
jgi:hypothetical protein